MRHVSRNHRVSLDWLFDRTNFDPKIQIMYIDTKNQLADILTTGIFTRDEWNNLLHLVNISIFSSSSCREVMSRRIIVAKSKPTLNLVSRSAASSSSAPSSSASRRLRILRAPSRRGSNLKAQCAAKLAAGGVQNQHDAASSSRVWRTDAKLSERAMILAAIDTSQGQCVPESARKVAADDSK